MYVFYAMADIGLQGRTQTLNFYRVGPDPGQLVLVDAPGYGGRGRPEWGELFDHYVDNRSAYVSQSLYTHALALKIGPQAPTCVYPVQRKTRLERGGPHHAPISGRKMPGANKR